MTCHFAQHVLGNYIRRALGRPTNADGDATPVVAGHFQRRHAFPYVLDTVVSAVAGIPIAYPDVAQRGLELVVDEDEGQFGGLELVSLQHLSPDGENKGAGDVHHLRALDEGVRHGVRDLARPPAISLGRERGLGGREELLGGREGEVAGRVEAVVVGGLVTEADDQETHVVERPTPATWPLFHTRH